MTAGTEERPCGLEELDGIGDVLDDVKAGNQVERRGRERDILDEPRVDLESVLSPAELRVLLLGLDTGHAEAARAGAGEKTTRRTSDLQESAPTRQLAVRHRRPRTLEPREVGRCDLRRVRE